VAANIPLAAECLVAISGVFPTEPLTTANANAAEALPKEWQQAIREFFEAEKASKALPSPKIRYLALWKQLNRRQNDAAIIVDLGEPAVALAYTARLKVARDYLHSQWQPLQLYDITGRATLLDPAPSENERCADLFAVVNSPTRLLEQLRAGSVLDAEVEAVAQVFPELRAMLGAFVYGEMMRQRRERSSWEPAFWQEVAVRALLGLPYNEVTPVKPPEQTQGGAATPPELDIQVNRKRADFETKTQRLGDASP
jgi:hypothetical protein